MTSSSGESELLHLRVMRLSNPSSVMSPTSYMHHAINDVFAAAAAEPVIEKQQKSALPATTPPSADPLIDLPPPPGDKLSPGGPLPHGEELLLADCVDGPPLDVGSVVDAGSLLILPATQGKIYVGETFQAYVNLANLGDTPVFRVRMQIELQLGNNSSSRFLLFDSSKNAVEAMRPSDTLDCSVVHKVSEVSVYTLVCSVAYYASIGTPQRVLRRMYKFNVGPPFKISHKVTHINNRATVQVTLENQTEGPIFLNDAVVHCAEGVEGVRLDSADHTRPTRGFRGLCHFKAKEIYSLLFSLAASATADKQNPSFLKRLTHLGTLSLEWRTPVGGSGSINDFKIVRPRRTAKLIELTVISCPASVHVESPFKIEVQVANRLDRPVEPLLVFDREKMSPLFTQGIATQTIGVVPPRESKKFPLPLIAVKPGLHYLQGVTLYDPVANQAEDCGGLCEILAF